MRKENFTVFLLMGILGAVLGSFTQGSVAASILTGLQTQNDPAFGALLGAGITVAFFVFLLVFRIRLPFAPGWLPAIVSFLCWLSVLIMVCAMHRDGFTSRTPDEMTWGVIVALMSLVAFTIGSYLINLVLFFIFVRVLGFPWPERDSWG